MVGMNLESQFLVFQRIVYSSEANTATLAQIFMESIPSMKSRCRIFGTSRWHLPLGGIVFLLVAGCSSLSFRGQSPEPVVSTDDQNDGPQLVAQLTIPLGLTYQKVESVALVTGLPGTGSDPPNSSRRQVLLTEMQRHDVKNPNQVLSWPSTSLVLVRGFIPPGAQEGDKFDIEVLTPRRSETSSLRGGWLMQSQLRELAVLGGSIRSGLPIGFAAGPVVVDTLFKGSDDSIHESRGRVLGGGLVKHGRSLGLGVRSRQGSIRSAMLIASAVNKRFHTFEHGIKKGVANPKQDDLIELAVDSRYRNNLVRYIKVIRSIAVGPDATELANRLPELELQLVDPATSARAALQLEAIGKPAIETLKKGLTASDFEVRFYAAESLAYLDEADAVVTLGEAARQNPAFRWHALTALAAMDHVSAYDVLSELIHLPSAETRYGAFHAIHTRNSGSPIIAGEWLGDEFSLHVVVTRGEPMIHFSRNRRPEIVLFGHQIPISPPRFLSAGKRILITGTDTGRLKVSRFAPNEQTAYLVCPADVESMIRAIHQLGGGYAEVLEAMRAAKRGELLPARIAVEATPRASRRYGRRTTKDASSDADSGSKPVNPIPDMFSNRLDSERTANKQDKKPVTEQPEEEKPGFFGRMTSWFR